MSTSDLLDQRVAWLACEIEGILSHEAELSPQAREALLAICADAAGLLERRKLELASPKPPRPAG